MGSEERPLEPYQVDAYLLGQRLGRGPRIIRTEVVRREVHIKDDETVLIEEVTYIDEETY